jgi:hypothetical protein
VCTRREELILTYWNTGYGQFLFEISLRTKHADSPTDIFVTYKGVSPSVGSRRRSEMSEISIEALPSGSLPVSIPILVAQPRSNASGHFDGRMPFASTSAGGGLVELSAYGVVPFQKQELGLLKNTLQHFIFQRPEDAPSLDSSSDQDFNVFASRGGNGTMEYFLFVAGALQKGQTLRLRFPSISTLLQSERYENSALRDRLIIDEALGVLSQDDLRQILTWLQDVFESSDSLKNPQGQAEESFQRVCEQRRRLHWLCRRTASLLKTPSEADKETERALYFGPQLTTLENCPAVERKLVFSTQVKEEILASLENDSLCGTHMRSKWKVATDMFNAFIDQIAACFCFSGQESADEFLRKMKLVFQPFFEVGDVTQLQNLLTRQSIPLNQKSDILNAEWDGIACEDKSTKGEGKIIFKSLKDASDEREGVALGWYREILWGIAASVLASFEGVLDESERKQFNVQEVIDSLRKASLEVDKALPEAAKLSRLSKARICVPRELVHNQETEKHVPGSYQFFLGIVWPALRNQGWRLDAGECASEVVFFPPKTGKRKRAALAKKEGNKKRLRLGREVDKIGWGSVKKSTQRLVVAVSPVEEQEQAEDGSMAITTTAMASSTSVSVADATKQFFEWIEKDLSSDDNECIERARSIADALRNCFDKIAPYISDGAGWSVLPNTTGNPSATYGAEALLLLLLVLPSLLRQSSLPLQEISDSLQIIQDLADFFTADSEKLLDKRCRPSEEHYIDEAVPMRSNLAERLRLLKPSRDSANGNGEGKEGVSNVMTETVLEEDKKWPSGEWRLTDFVVKVMEQVVPCRANDRDAGKKFRRIHVGYPGMACRHCLGAAGEGRYFFTTLESLTTASTVLEKHVLKCPAVPPEIKSEVAAAKVTHPGQRKALVAGSQQGYFNRLWDRLRSSNIAGEAPNVPMSQPDKEEKEESNPSGGGDDTESDGLEFRDHVLLLDFVRNTSVWKNNKNIQAALSKYYSCLDYGGRIYQTPSMPKHFSSEWLLAKVVPKRYEYAKAKYLPG